MPRLERLDRQPNYDERDKYELALDRTDAVTVGAIKTRPGLFGLHIQNGNYAPVFSAQGLTEQQLRNLRDEITLALERPTK